MMDAEGGWNLTKRVRGSAALLFFGEGDFLLDWLISPPLLWLLFSIMIGVVIRAGFYYCSADVYYLSCYLLMAHKYTINLEYYLHMIMQYNTLHYMVICYLMLSKL